MSIKQKITSIKDGANFDSADAALAEIKSVIGWDGSNNADSTDRTLIGTTTLVETRIWDEEQFEAYRNVRFAGGIFRTNTTKMADAGWVIIEEIDDVITFSH